MRGVNRYLTRSERAWWGWRRWYVLDTHTHTKIRTGGYSRWDAEDLRVTLGRIEILERRFYREF